MIPQFPNPECAAEQTEDNTEMRIIDDSFEDYLK